MHPDDIAAAGLGAGQRVDIQSRTGAETRQVRGFTIVGYDLPRRTTATYYPEGNPLVHIDRVADKSGTPAFKSVVITIRPAAEQ
jgi:anaerobic selenocysteine-containing dehydrogenase